MTAGDRALARVDRVGLPVDSDGRKAARADGSRTQLEMKTCSAGGRSTWRFAEVALPTAKWQW